MALLEYVTEVTATEGIEDYMDQSWYTDESGHHFRRIRLNNPPVLAAQDAFKEALMDAGRVDDDLFEVIMVVVAEANDCTYCAGSHRTFLAQRSDLSPAEADAIAEGTYDPLSDRDRAVARFADKAARDPHRIVEADIDGLHEVGFDAADVIQLLGVIGYCQLCNLIASSLDVDANDPLPA